MLRRRVDAEDAAPVLQDRRDRVWRGNAGVHIPYCYGRAGQCGRNSGALQRDSMCGFKGGEKGGVPSRAYAIEKIASVVRRAGVEVLRKFVRK